MVARGRSGCGNTLRGPSRFSRRWLLALICGFLLIVAVETVRIDVIDDLVRNVVADALTPLTEKADLGRGHVVLNELRDHADVLLPLRKLDERVIC
jgi:hypothetical protein